MKFTDEAIMNKTAEPIRAFRLRQALVAAKLDSSDEVVLNYLDFFTEFIPTESIYFLHVLPQFDLFNITVERSAQSLISNIELNEGLINRMDAEIKGRMSKDKAVKISFDVREGNPLEELLRDTKELEADLVVIGQRSGTNRHGILAKNLARKINCKALIIPDLARPKITKILAPIDFSAYSGRALQTAVALSKQLPTPTQVIALNVYDMPNLSVYRIQKTREQLKKMIETDRVEAFKHFIGTFVGADGRSIQTALVEREMPGIANYLMNYANANAVDFIVMGAKGHSKVERLLLGSVTEKLLSDNERIPTLVVK